MSSSANSRRRLAKRAIRAILGGQGEGWIFLDWKEPIESEITLSDQTRAVEREYRVVAVNKAGDGEPSNTVMAVL